MDSIKQIFVFVKKQVFLSSEMEKEINIIIDQKNKKYC